MEWKICLHCDKVFFRRAKEPTITWNGRKYCSNSCKGKSYVGRLVEQNKSRRKYPAVEGITRQSVFYRHNPEKATRDTGMREEVIGHLGGACVQCGYDADIRALVLDHKNGNGSEDRKRLGCKIARYYVKHLDEAGRELQVLCSNCNKIKAIENKEHNKSRRLDDFQRYFGK